MAEVRIGKNAVKDMRSLPPDILTRIAKALKDLERDPFPQDVVKIVGSEQSFCVRIGDYRIVYEWDPDHGIVNVYRIRHRKDVYR